MSSTAPATALAPGVGGVDNSADETAATAKDRYNTLKSVYEARLRGVVAQLKDTLFRVQTDPGVSTLSADATTAEFVPARVDEVLDSALASEREATITRLMEACAARDVELRTLQRVTAARASADAEKLSAQHAVIATLQAQFGVLENQVVHEREQARVQVATAASALAAANAARDQAKALADQRLSALHAAQMDRMTAEAAVAAIQYQMAELEERLRASVNTVHEREKEMVALNSTVRSLSIDLGGAREVEARLTSEVQAKAAVIEDLSGQVSALQGRAAELEVAAERATEMELELGAVQRELVTHKDSLSAAVHNAANASARVNDLQRTVARLTAEVEDARVAAAAVSGEHEAAMATVAELTSTVEQLRSVVAARDTALATAMGEARTFAAAVKEVGEREGAAKRQAVAAEEAAARATQATAAAKQRVEALEAEVVTLTARGMEERTRHAAEMAELQASAMAAKRLVEEGKVEAARLTELAEAASGEAAALRSRLAAAEREAAELRRQAEEAQGRALAAQAAVAESKESMAMAQTMLAAKQTEVDELEASVAAAGQQVAALQAAVAGAEGERDRLRGECTALQGQYLDLLQETAQIDTLRNEVAQMRVERGSLAAAFHAAVAQAEAMAGALSAGSGTPLPALPPAAATSPWPETLTSQLTTIFEEAMAGVATRLSTLIESDRRGSTEVATLRTHIASLDATIAEATARVGDADALRKDHEAARARVSELESALSLAQAEAERWRAAASAATTASEAAGAEAASHQAAAAVQVEAANAAAAAAAAARDAAVRKAERAGRQAMVLERHLTSLLDTLVAASRAMRDGGGGGAGHDVTGGWAGGEVGSEASPVATRNVNLTSNYSTVLEAGALAAATALKEAAFAALGNTMTSADSTAYGEEEGHRPPRTPARHPDATTDPLSPRVHRSTYHLAQGGGAGVPASPATILTSISAAASTTPPRSLRGGADAVPITSPAAALMQASQAHFTAAMGQVASAISHLTRQAREAEAVRAELQHTREVADQLKSRAAMLQQLAAGAGGVSPSGKTTVTGMVASPARGGQGGDGPTLATVMEELAAARTRIAAMEAAATVAHEAAAAAAVSAQEQVHAAMKEAQTRGTTALEALVALVSDLSASHAEEIARLNEQAAAWREHAAMAEAQAQRVSLQADARVAQAQTAFMEQLAAESERVRQEVMASMKEALAAANERADKASTRLRGLRDELMKMANDADRRIGQEVSKRESVEKRCRKAESSLGHAQVKITTLQHRVEELSAALTLSTDALRKAEGRAGSAAAGSGSSGGGGGGGGVAVLEAAALRSVLDRTMASLRGRRGSSGGGATGGEGGGGSGGGGNSDGGDELSDSLASAARLSDLTHRLSAYVRSGTRIRPSTTATAHGNDSGGAGQRDHSVTPTSSVMSSAHHSDDGGSVSMGSSLGGAGSDV